MLSESLRKLDVPEEKENWRTAVDANTGRSYWYHRKTRESTWVQPTCLQTVALPSVVPVVPVVKEPIVTTNVNHKVDILPAKEVNFASTAEPSRRESISRSSQVLSIALNGFCQPKDLINNLNSKNASVKEVALEKLTSVCNKETAVEWLREPNFLRSLTEIMMLPFFQSGPIAPKQIHLSKIALRCFVVICTVPGAWGALFDDSSLWMISASVFSVVKDVTIGILYCYAICQLIPSKCASIFNDSWLTELCCWVIRCVNSDGAMDYSVLISEAFSLVTPSSMLISYHISKDSGILLPCALLTTVVWHVCGIRNDRLDIANVTVLVNGGIVKILESVYIMILNDYQRGKFVSVSGKNMAKVPDDLITRLNDSVCEILLRLSAVSSTIRSDILRSHLELAAQLAYSLPEVVTTPESFPDDSIVEEVDPESIDGLNSSFSMNYSLCRHSSYTRLIQRHQIQKAVANGELLGIHRDVEWTPKSGGRSYRLCSSVLWARCPSLRTILSNYWAETGGGGGLELSMDANEAVLSCISQYIHTGILIMPSSLVPDQLDVIRVAIQLNMTRDFTASNGRQEGDSGFLVEEAMNYVFAACSARMTEYAVLTADVSEDLEVIEEYAAVYDLKTLLNACALFRENGYKVAAAKFDSRIQGVDKLNNTVDSPLHNEINRHLEEVNSLLNNSDGFGSLYETTGEFDNLGDQSWTSGYGAKKPVNSTTKPSSKDKSNSHTNRKGGYDYSSDKITSDWVDPDDFSNVVVASASKMINASNAYQIPEFQPSKPLPVKEKVITKPPVAKRSEVRDSKELKLVEYESSMSLGTSEPKLTAQQKRLAQLAAPRVHKKPEKIDREDQDEEEADQEVIPLKRTPEEPKVKQKVRDSWVDDRDKPVAKVSVEEKVKPKPDTSFETNKSFKSDGKTPQEADTRSSVKGSLTLLKKRTASRLSSFNGREDTVDDYDISASRDQVPEPVSRTSSNKQSKPPASSNNKRPSYSESYSDEEAEYVDYGGAVYSGDMKSKQGKSTGPRVSSSYDDADSSNIPEYGDDGPSCECPQCGRKFNEKALAVHSRICAKVFLTKRKEYSSAEHRKVPDEGEVIMKGPKKKTKPVAKSGNSDKESGEKAGKIPSWKLQSMQFRAAMRAAQGREPDSSDVVLVSGKPAVLDDGLTQCPHCSRRFNESAAERHIPKCRDIIAKPTTLLRKGGSNAMTVNNRPKR